MIDRFLRENFGHDAFPVDDSKEEALIREAFMNVGLMPTVEKPRQNKNEHFSKLRAIFKEKTNKELDLCTCILFDDSKQNVDQSSGFVAVHVKEKDGFCFKNLDWTHADQFEENPYCFIVGH